MPRAELGEVTHCTNFVIQPDLEVEQIFEVTGIPTAMLLEDVGARPRSVEDGNGLARLLPLCDVFAIKVEDVALVVGRSTVVHYECVTVEAFRHSADESGLTDTVGTGDDNEHLVCAMVQVYYVR